MGMTAKELGEYLINQGDTPVEIHGRTVAGVNMPYGGPIELVLTGDDPTPPRTTSPSAFKIDREG